MKSFIFNNVIIFLFFLSIQSFGQSRLEIENNKTPTYSEVIKIYKELATNHKQAFLIEEGSTDVGKPLHVFVISADKDFSPKSLRKKNKRILLINNGIHPGESCGIDASILFATDLLSGKLNANEFLKNTVVCIIPVYNIGGALNRGPYSRMNQVGPEEHGFRGNAKNLDLNRDFIKCDSENSKSFARIFHKWKPDFFVDTHTSNGADYQYTLTLIATQSDKLNPLLANYMDNKIIPYLYDKMKRGNYEMIPYVQSIKRTPDSGIYAFNDSPRYASGYASLFNTISFITETHMLKPYKDRVYSTYNFIENLTRFIEKNSDEIGKLVQKANNQTITKQDFSILWELDKTRDSIISFKGYEASFYTSKITNKKSLYYNRTKPYNKEIKYYQHYNSVKQIKKPEMYIIPQSWKEVISLLKLNGIQLKQLRNDVEIPVIAYYIDDFKTRDAYEGHYLHYNTKTYKEEVSMVFYKGDYIVETNQLGNNYIVNVLEPEAVDSFFAWNFFDAILQGKEYISDYIFEDIAIEILKDNPKIKEALETAKKSNKLLNESHYRQLYFIYKKSKYFEKTYRRYPVYRVENKIDLKLK